MTDNKEDISLLRNLSIYVNYESVMFYSRSPERTVFVTDALGWEARVFLNGKLFG